MDGFAGIRSVRCYSAGRPWSESSEWLEKHVLCYSDPQRSLRVAREMFFRRFGVRMERRNIEQLRGIEGVRVRESYKLLANRFGIPWNGRRYKPGNPDGSTDGPNLALNVANTCLYGLTETAVHATGTSAALGFIHRGSQLSFVLDIADLYKLEEMVPVAFAVVARKECGAEPWPELEMEVRRACRDLFRRSKLLERIVNDITEILDVGAET